VLAGGGRATGKLIGCDAVTAREMDATPADRLAFMVPSLVMLTPAE